MSENKSKLPLVLLVDDEEVIRDLVGIILRDNGFDVTTAADVDEALEIIKAKGDFNAIISDVKMPRKDGIELLKEAKKLLPITPVILLTGYAELQTARNAVTFGAYDYISKPLDEISQLIVPLNRAIEKNRMAHNNQKLMGDLMTINEDLVKLLDEMFANPMEPEELKVKVARILEKHKENEKVNAPLRSVWAKWVDVHIQIIDSQHKEILGALDVIAEAAKLGSKKEAVKHVFEILVKYLSVHFTTEEALMLKFSYPGYEMHAYEHRFCLSKTLELWEKYDQGDEPSLQELTSFLKLWIDDHIPGTDQLYCLYFKEMGLLSQINN